MSSHHPQEVLLAQFSLYVHKGGLKPDSFPLQTIFSISIIKVLATEKKHAASLACYFNFLSKIINWSPFFELFSENLNYIT